VAGGPLRLLPIVRQDIRDALAWTKERFGASKAAEYSALTRAALRALAADPHSGKRRPDIHPDAWVYPIRRVGRPARHLFLYEVVAAQAQIYGFLYDGMDLPEQWLSRQL
jgi:plasmid stabilization system protein ParE